MPSTSHLSPLNFSERRAGAYSNKDIILTLPPNISIHNLRWLSMYCITYNHNFGEVFFPRNLNVPAYVEPGKCHSCCLRLMLHHVSSCHNSNDILNKLPKLILTVKMKSRGVLPVLLPTMIGIVLPYCLGEQLRYERG